MVCFQFMKGDHSPPKGGAGRGGYSFIASTILLLLILHAGIAVPMSTVANIIRYTTAETTRKWMPKLSNQKRTAGLLEVKSSASSL